MKEGIHPKYQNTKVICSCGETFETRSTVPEIHVEICSVCHPFYTGKQKLVDTAGRVDKFRSKMEKANKLKDQKITASVKKVDKEIAEGKVGEAVAELDKDIEEIKEEIKNEEVVVEPESVEESAQEVAEITEQTEE